MSYDKEMADAPKRIWIDYKKANDGFTAYDERPDTPYSDCQDAYTRSDIADELAEALNHAKLELRMALFALGMTEDESDVMPMINAALAKYRTP